jgi:hypothetical protein
MITDRKGTKPSSMNCSNSGRTKKHSSLNDIRCSDFVKDGCALTHVQRKLVEFAGNLGAQLSLFVELLWFLVSGSRTSQSVLAYLAQREEIESDVWLRDDLRISWLTVLYASRGYQAPAISASYQVLGLHPDKVFPAILERRRGLLGSEYEQFAAVPPEPTEKKAAIEGGSVLGESALPPKKSPASVRPSRKKEQVQ